MENKTKHKIISVDNDSPASELGITAGDFLLSVNGEKIVDIIDYEQLISNENVVMCFEKADTGEEIEAEIEKDENEDIGLNFESSLMSPIRCCKNHCVFCFIDQMPNNTRETLHVKDDDFRLSLIMGNYITLTNIDESEFERILRRRVSPLYISVHATDGEVRKKMMRNPTAVNICERLSKLKEANIRFHCQIVLCPTINDGKILERSLADLKELGADSVAVVPVGLTKHREGLYPLRKLTEKEAQEAINTVEKFKQKGFDVYASDELYIAAGRELPTYEAYDDFPQIENGVGLLRLFEDGFNDELQYVSRKEKTVHIDAVTGVSAGKFMSSLFSKLEKYGIKIHTHILENEFFGNTVTVSGLLCGSDIISAYKNGVFTDSEILIIPCSMLRDGKYFLDGITLETLSETINKRIIPLAASDGSEFVAELFGEVL
ncbi:MAG: DUF512 domain-containing protein [Clostridia bacterium]|nr:DUF512 domain-containing protein [Clostridia bacterium]